MKCLQIAGSISLLLAGATSARAAAFDLPDQDAFAIGRGMAVVATADNPSAIYYNPAGITQLEGNNLRAGIYAIDLDPSYKSPISGQTFDNQLKYHAIPQFYYTYGRKDWPVSFGLGLYSPFGLGVIWPQETGFRTVATEGVGIEELLKAIAAAGASALVFPGPGPWPPAPGPQIDHLGIAVKSLEEALAFYAALGLQAAHRETVGGEKVNVALLPAGESRIELLEPSSPDSTIARYLEKRGPGLHHVALRVPDLNAAVERLRASGARLLNEPRQGAGGHFYVFVHPASTGGVLLELIQESGT
ncbi:MAG: methylmalonyl-CoA epimerase [Acidobacteriia bacterium]|nr:methylmalonyl-CoA epimerase [Terriglobia bacterium]